jgi:hypothetical protein
VPESWNEISEALTEIENLENTAPQDRIKAMLASWPLEYAVAKSI